MTMVPTQFSTYSCMDCFPGHRSIASIAIVGSAEQGASHGLYTSGPDQTRRTQ